MTGISIGSSNNTTGLMSGLGSTSFEEQKTTANPEERHKSWFSGGTGNASADTATNNKPSLTPPTSTKTNLALKVATSMASSAAIATAGAIATGAKAAKTAVVDRRNSSSQEGNNNNNAVNNETNPSMWRRLSWSKPNNNNNNIDKEGTCETTAAPSWTTTSSSSGISVGGNSDYGASNHIETTSRRQSLSAAWMARPKFRRRHTSPAIVFQNEQDAKTAQLELYKSLLSTPPSTITFVIRRNENLGVTSKNIRDLLGVRLVKSEETNHRFQVVCEDEGSAEEHDTPNESSSTQQPLTPPLLPPELTVLLRPGDFLESIDGIPVGGKRRMLGMGKNRYLDEDDLYYAIASTRNQTKNNDKTSANEYPTGQVEAIASETEEKKTDDLMKNNSYPTTTLTFVCGGTTLCPTESVTCTSDTPVAADSIESSTSLADETTASETMTSLDSSCNEEESTAQPSPKATKTVLPTVHKVYFLDHTGGNDGNGVDSGILDDFLTLQTVQKSIVDPKTSRFSLGNSTNSAGNNPSDLNKVGNSLLHIASIPENNWLGKQSKIKAGDILLCADDIPCYNGELSPGDLSLVWRTALMTKVLVADPVQKDAIETKQKRPTTSSYAGITICNVPPTRLESIRKTAVAATGGALVGTGAVLMVTPLHPVGHAMAIGGLGVLGTEFEAPKKAFEKAKQSAVNLAQKVKKQPKETTTTTTSVEKQDTEDNNEEAEDKFVTL